MIYYLNGTLADIFEDSIIIDVAGVGYHVIVPSSLLKNLPSLGKAIKLLTYHHIREDQQLLFGFLSKPEKELFLKLTSVSGVGPKVGIKILSELNATDLAKAILGGHVATLVGISGVGKKMAERLIIELKDKLDNIHTETAATLSANSIDSNYLDDLTLALKTLGYTKDEIKKAIHTTQDHLSSKDPIQTSIKKVLQKI